MYLVCDVCCRRDVWRTRVTVRAEDRSVLGGVWLRSRSSQWPQVEGGETFGTQWGGRVRDVESWCAYRSRLSRNRSHGECSCDADCDLMLFIHTWCCRRAFCWQLQKLNETAIPKHAPTCPFFTVMISCPGQPRRAMKIRQFLWYTVWCVHGVSSVGNRMDSSSRYFLPHTVRHSIVTCLTLRSQWPNAHLLTSLSLSICCFHCSLLHSVLVVFLHRIVITTYCCCASLSIKLTCHVVTLVTRGYTGGSPTAVQA